MLIAALEPEVEETLAQYSDVWDETGRRLVVRNGHCPERSIQTGVGSIEIRRPRVNDRRLDKGWQPHSVREQDPATVPAAQEVRQGAWLCMGTGSWVRGSRAGRSMGLTVDGGVAWDSGDRFPQVGVGRRAP